MTKTAASTEQNRRRRLASAWARIYGGNGPVSQHDDINDAPRPVADAQAAWRRWHDQGLDHRWSAAEWPWFSAIERARVEQLAGDHLPGMASNLLDPNRTAPPPGLVGDVYRSARHIFSGADSLVDPVFEKIESKGISRRWRFWRSRRQPPLDDTELVAFLLDARLSIEYTPKFVDIIKPLISLLSNLELYGLDCSSSTATPNSASIPGIVTEKDLDQDATEDESAGIQKPGDATSATDLLRAHPEYRIYSTALDKVGHAEHWARPEDAELLKSLISPDRRKMRHLAHKLQRRLRAASLSRWQFDLEEGLLDSRRLSRLIGDKANHRVFRREEESPASSACVYFLVDLSGSMRGERQRISAMAIDLAVHVLESCGIETEVLGYTTAYGADNPIVAQWERAGAPRNAGRLNAVQHIVFKTAGQRWRRTRSGLGLILREGFGRENVDGEALYWAARRLAVRPEPNRILMVLSDGQPYDEATTESNDRSFLEDHLRSVIAEIDQSCIRLTAIGTKMSVSRFYGHSLTISSPEDLGQCLFNHLEELLVSPKDMRGRE